MSKNIKNKYQLLQVNYHQQIPILHYKMTENHLNYMYDIKMAFIETIKLL